MIGLQLPHEAPAFVAAPTAATLSAPFSVMATRIWPFETPLQSQT